MSSCTKPHIEDSRIMLCEIGFACFVTVMGRCLRDIGVLFAGAGCSTLSAVLVANLAHVVSLFAIAAVCGLKGVALFGPRSSVVSTSLFVLGYLGVVFFRASQYEASPFVLPFQMCFGLAGAVGMIGWVSAFFHEGERALKSSRLPFLHASLALPSVPSTMSPLSACFAYSSLLCQVPVQSG